MLLKTVFNSATAQQFMQLSEDLKNISCGDCLLGKIFKILRVRQYRILFTSGQSVYNIRLLECLFVQITTKLLHNRYGYTRPLARGEPWGYGLGWVYPGLCSTPRLRLHACKLPKGLVSVDRFWRETCLHVNMEDLNDELFFGLISVIITALLLNRPPQLSSAIQRFILRRQRRR